MPEERAPYRDEGSLWLCGGCDPRRSLTVGTFGSEEAGVVKIEVAIDRTSIKSNLPQRINFIEVGIAFDLCQRNRDRFGGFLKYAPLHLKSPSILASVRSS